MRSVMAGPQFFEPGTGSGPRGRPGLSDGLVPPILSSYTPTANSVRNFKSKSGTRIVELLVPLCFRSSCQSVLGRTAYFGNGAPGASTHASYQPACASTDRLMRCGMFRRLRPVFSGGFGADRSLRRSARERGPVERHALDAAAGELRLLGGEGAGVDAHPGDLRRQPPVLDLRAAVHHHLQARLLG